MLFIHQLRGSLVRRLLIALLGTGVLMTALSAQATNQLYNTWVNTYPDSLTDDNAGCVVCHNTPSGSGGFNSYGADVFIDGIRGAEDLDSDGDPGGCTNIEEINLNTQPAWTPPLPSSIDPSWISGDLDPDSSLCGGGLPGTLQFSSATYSVNENGGSVSISVTRTGGSDGAVTVDYATSDGTANAGSDYTHTTGTLTLADGVTSASFSVPIIDDTEFEGDETVNLALSSPTGGATLGTPSSAVLTIADDDPPPSAGSLQFSSTTYNVDENGVSISILVTRTGGDFGEVTVDYTTSDDTATAGSDYTSTSGTLTLLDSELSASFNVPILNDTTYEGDETVNLALSNPTGGATLGNPSNALLTIVDDDPIPSAGTLQFSSAAYAVNENGGSILINVTRTGGDFGEVTVDYTTSDGTATAGSDYTSTSGTLTLLDSELSASFSVPITDDTTFENDETVNLILSSPTGGATLGNPSSAVLTIVDDDPAPLAGSLQFSGATYSVDENGGSILIAVTRTGGDFGEVTVDYTTSDGTATAGSDYTTTSGTLTLLDGETSASFSVPILDDTIYEGDETVNLTLSNPTGDATLGTPSSAVLSIVEDDPVPVAGSLQFSGATYSVAETGVSIEITVTRTGGSDGAITVDYATSDGTATAGSDYTTATGTLTLADGVTSGSFTVPILDDTIYEGNETVNLTLSNPTGDATLGTPSNAVLTIVENELPPLSGSLQFSGSTYSVDEFGGSALITVTRTGGDFGTVSVNYTTSDGTATAGSDYTTTSGTLILLNGETSASFSVPILDDTIYEGDETVNLTLSNPTGDATLGTPSSAVLSIVEDDPVPVAGSLQFSGATYSVAETGVSIEITVTRTGGSDGAITVDYATSDGTATAGSDYTTATGTLTLADGVTSGSFTVPILDDTIYEGNETVNLTLSNPTGDATLGTPSSAVLTIVEDDPVPSPGSLQFSGEAYSVAENGDAALITVTRTGGSAGIVSVEYDTSDGSGTAGSDYSSTSGTLTLLDGETSASFSVPIIDDTEIEGDETVNLTLSNPIDAILGTPDTAVLTIQDNDPVGDADVFLSKMRVPSLLTLREDRDATRRIIVFGDGNTIEQDATVTLSASHPDIKVEIEPESLTSTVTPGRPDTRFSFTAEIECEEAGRHTLEWTAVIDAAENADPTNDSLTLSTTVECKAKRSRRGRDDD